MCLYVKLKTGIPFAMQFKMYKDKIVHLQAIVSGKLYIIIIAIILTCYHFAYYCCFY